MIRTWHGWVESGKIKDKKQRNRLRKLPPGIPRTTRTDYNWIFWDPTGELQRKFNQKKEKSLVRYLPRWMRSSPFGSAAPGSSASYDLEASRPTEARGSGETFSSENVGILALLGQRWHRRWHRARTWASSSDTCIGDSEPASERQSVDNTAVEQENFNGSLNTIRLRRSRKQADSAYELDSEDIERATKTLLIRPTAAGDLLRLFQNPSITATPPSPSVDTRGAEHPQNIAVNLPPPHQLHDNQYRPGIYPITFRDGHRHAGTTSPEGYTISDHCLPRRLSTLTYGLDGSHPNSNPAVSVNTESYTLPHSALASLIDVDTESLDRFSFEEPTIHVPRKRGGTRSTLDSTAEAESMSVINMPSHGGQRISEVDDSFDPQAYEQAREMDDADGISSVSSSSWSRSRVASMS
ncbi:MAG: hypothetical protein L6R36_002608 [Xanthoria steineri]|nr:MAG: hypothetical protein L6R36_002608 [Xanthoria steineri]